MKNRKGRISLKPVTPCFPSSGTSDQLFPVQNNDLADPSRLPECGGGPGFVLFADSTAANDDCFKLQEQYAGSTTR